MRKTLNVQIDHVGLFSNSLHPAEALFKMGFVGEAAVTELQTDENGQAVRCVRFMMDNGYLECAINRDPSKYCGVLCGVNYFEFASADAETTHRFAAANGFSPTPVHHAVRPNARHGEKTGDAVFECVSIGYEVFPTIETETVCHLTPELFYHNNRFMHRNRVSYIDGVILACESEQAAAAVEGKLAKLHQGLGEFPKDYAVRKLTLMDSKSIESDYAVRLPEDSGNTIGVVLTCDDKAALLQCLRSASLAHRELNGAVVVDLISLQNMYFIFR